LTVSTRAAVQKTPEGGKALWKGPKIINFGPRKGKNNVALLSEGVCYCRKLQKVCR
jgi:hypothetical protein